VFGINGWEFIALGIVAVLVLGPERLPEYAAKLARFVVKARGMAEDAKGQLKTQLGPEYENVNWRQYDPRQYDPRRIVRDALLEPLTSVADDLNGVLNDTPEPGAAVPPAAPMEAVSPFGFGRTWDPDLPTPYDGEAT
jgi:sec-independent protein translocase protein TatB